MCICCDWTGLGTCSRTTWFTYRYLRHVQFCHHLLHHFSWTRRTTHDTWKKKLLTELAVRGLNLYKRKGKCTSQHQSLKLDLSRTSPNDHLSSLSTTGTFFGLGGQSVHSLFLTFLQRPPRHSRRPRSKKTSWRRTVNQRLPNAVHKTLFLM